MTRREKARTVCERLAARIREVVPVGLGRWEPVWTLVASPSDVFMDALKEWENEDSPTTRPDLEAAFTDLVRAWAEAAHQWEEAGCPSLEETNDREVEAGVGELVS